MMKALAASLSDNKKQIESVAGLVGKVEFANQLRGLAALSVVFSHYFVLYYSFPQGVSALINIPAAQSQPVPLYLQYIELEPYFSWGAFGVAIFFLISGFVIPFALHRTSVKMFVLNRVLRIYPTYIVGFSISLFVLYLAGKYFERSWILSWEHIGIHYFPGLRDLFNVPMIDGIIWTLDIEMKFYATCAFCIFWFRSRDALIYSPCPS